MSNIDFSKYGKPSVDVSKLPLGIYGMVTDAIINHVRKHRLKPQRIELHPKDFYAFVTHPSHGKGISVDGSQATFNGVKIVENPLAVMPLIVDCNGNVEEI